jgi:hypothetical protein
LLAGFVKCSHARIKSLGVGSKFLLILVKLRQILGVLGTLCRQCCFLGFDFLTASI